MGNSQVMPKVDFQKEDLKTASAYKKYIEAKNFERYLFAKKTIKKKRIVFFCSLAVVFGIYSYTLIRIRQETFLDDFEEPERIAYKFSPLPTIKELLKLYNIRALRNLSQNFLLQKELTNKIVDAAGSIENCEVCEIGPGPGSITRSILLKNAKKVLAIEKDKRFEPMLESLQETSNGKLNVVYADIMDYDLSHSFDSSLKKNWEDQPPKIHLIGNLPFNISNVLIFQYLKDISLRRNAWKYGRVCLTLTFQEEVARRIVSEILLKSRSRISVMCQNWCDVSYKFTIPGRAFLPKPQVNVGVVHFEPLIQPHIDLEYEIVGKVVSTVFNSRQKFIMNTIMKLFPKEFQKTLSKQMLELADLNSHLRPYQISLQEWKRLCHAYKCICDRNPRLYSYKFNAPIKVREQDWKISQKSVI